MSAGRGSIIRWFHVRASTNYPTPTSTSPPHLPCVSTTLEHLQFTVISKIFQVCIIYAQRLVALLIVVRPPVQHHQPVTLYNSLMTLKILLAPAIAVSNELQQSCINPRPIVQVKLLRAALHSSNWLLMELEGKYSSLHSRVDRQRTQNAKCTLVVCP